MMITKKLAESPVLPVTSGSDAPDSINYIYSTPGGSSNTATENYENDFYELHPIPEEGFGPYSGYTVEEIEELFDSSESIVGEYQFQYTANAQAGQASGGCERDDPSVQIQYYIELLYFDYEVIEFTGFEEMMDGRVKTLHPKIHAGILARRDSDMEILKEKNYEPIDLVVVNLYPFQETIASECSFEEAIEKIDIGGPTMIRAADKKTLKM